MAKRKNQEVVPTRTELQIDAMEEVMRAIDNLNAAMLFAHERGVKTRTTDVGSANALGYRDESQATELLVTFYVNNTKKEIK